MSEEEAYYKIEEALYSGATELNLSNKNLTRLPESLGRLTKLQKLYVSHNELTIIPDVLANLTQLQSLSLSYNQLGEIPKWLGQFTQLQSLDLANNKFRELPESFGELAKLEELNISNNPLILLPESLENLRNLKKLMFVTSGLESLPIQICKLRNLETLILGTGEYPGGVFMIIGKGGSLKSLPAELGNLSSLKVLLLGKNKITDIPSSLAQLENLIVLDLDKNPLNAELATAYGQGLAAIKTYLRAKATARKLKVFFCYASQDKPIVTEVYQNFVAEGWIEPWLDAKNLMLGQDWQAEIRNAVEKADNVLIFLSKSSINKDGFVQKELRLAKELALQKSEGSLFLLPLRIDNCEVPRDLQIYQWGNYFGEEKIYNYNKLLESLRFRLNQIISNEHPT